LAKKLEHYFAVMSELSGYASSDKALAAAIHRLTKDASDVTSVRHPLERWNIRSQLFADLQVDPALVPPAADTDAPETGVCRDRRESAWSNAQLATPPYRFEIRPHRTDYAPRSGTPSSYDYKLATVFGKKVGEMLANSQFGLVPCLREVVPFEELDLGAVKAVRIEEIKTLFFDQDDYFDAKRLEVSPKITNFFRTITTGPKDLEEVIANVDRNGLSHTPRRHR
jgi:6-phosphofructokinase